MGMLKWSLVFRKRNYSFHVNMKRHSDSHYELLEPRQINKEYKFYQAMLFLPVQIPLRHAS